MIDYIILPLKELISSGDYSEDFLMDSFERFECQKEDDLSNFLQINAYRREKENKTSTYLFLSKELFMKGELEIIAFISIGNTSIDVSELTPKQRKTVFGSTIDKRDQLNSIPAFLIGQLGRTDKYTSKDLDGKTILYEAVSILKDISEKLSGDVIILECREHMFEIFYEKYGFRKLMCTHETDGEGFVLDLLKSLIRNYSKKETKSYMFRKYGSIARKIIEEEFENFGIMSNLNMIKILQAKIEFVELENKRTDDSEADLLTLHARLSKFEF